MKGQETTVKDVKEESKRQGKSPLQWEWLSTEQAVQRACGDCSWRHSKLIFSQT